MVNHRLSECGLMWTANCSAVGWVIHLRREATRHQGRAWPIIVVPLLVAVWLAVAEAADSYGEFVKPSMMPRSFYLLGVGLHLAVGALLAGVLWWQCRVWKRWGAAGICPVCQYDLRGNESGRCSECGTPIEADSRIPLWFFSREHRWLPELSHFETASQRQLAFQQATRAMQRTLSGWVTLIVLFLPVLCFTPTVQTWLGKKWTVTLVALTLLAFAMIWVHRRRMRALLRQQLADQGRPTEHAK